MTVFPAILSGDLAVVSQQLEQVITTDLVTTAHIDVIDGFFADTTTITPSDLVGQNFGELDLDLHLMTEEPLDFVYEIKDVKQHLPVRSIIAQVERLSNQAEFIRAVKVEGWKVGLALDLFTPVEAIDPESWRELDTVLVMGVEAGAQGQQFHTHALSTLLTVDERLQLQKQLETQASDPRQPELIVDGGITTALLAQLKNHGATGVAVGSALWQAPNFLEALTEFTRP